MPRIRASTSASSALETRSVLLSTMTSANAIWFLASGASFSRSLSHFASATVTTASSRALFCTSSSTKKVCATGAGSASPVVSTMMASNLPLRFIRPSRMRTRSPRTVQHMQPLFISNTSSSAPITRSLSMPVSPNSLTMTAYLLPWFSDRMRLRRVVLPAPRYPVSTVTGIFWDVNSGIVSPERYSWATPGSREAPALIRQRARQGPYIVPDHINVSGGFALFIRQAVGIERSADPGAALGRDPLHQPRIADIFKKNGWNFRSLDLADNPGNVARAGFGFGGNALWRDEFDAIGGGEIAEGVMGGDHLAVVLRDLRHRFPHLAVERVEFRQIGLRLASKALGVSGVGGNKRVADIGHICLRIGNRLPGMRIGVGAEFERRDALG